MNITTLRAPDAGEDLFGVSIPREHTGSLPPSQRAQLRANTQNGPVITYRSPEREGQNTTWRPTGGESGLVTPPDPVPPTGPNLNSRDSESEYDSDLEPGSEIRLTLRVHPQLHADLQRIAHDRKRSLNSEIEWALEQWALQQRTTTP